MKIYKSRGTYALIVCALLFCLNIKVCAEDAEYDALFGSWGGVKNTLEDSGVTVEANVISDVMSLVSGGLDRGNTQVFNYNFGLEIDTEAAGLWKNGTFLFSGLGINGGPLYNRVGDIQYTSNIDGMGVDTASVYESWYEHSFNDGKFTLLFGLHDYNSEFYVLDYAMSMLNSSFGFGLENSQTGISTYPVTALGLRARLETSENSYALFGMYDGVSGDPNNLHGTHVNLRSNDGAFYTAEYGLTSSEDATLQGDYYKVALGGWYRTTNYVDYGDTLNKNTAGGYLIGEKQIFAESDASQGLGIFAQFGCAEAASNSVSQYTGAGFHYTGLIPNRDQDITGFGFTQVRRPGRYLALNSDSTRSETAIELTHSANLGRGIRIQPDFQYVINPGTNKNVGNALVLGSRIEVVF